MMRTSIGSRSFTSKRALTGALLLTLFLSFAWIAARPDLIGARAQSSSPKSDPPYRTDFSASRPINPLAEKTEVRPDPPYRTDFSANRPINPLAAKVEVRPDPPFRTDFSASRPITQLRSSPR
ncbi:MAG: hypothetical protein LAN71_13495 [Acidobacteriia bacterium]|nr:hypothetical protein [Terriglobia bacterium]